MFSGDPFDYLSFGKEALLLAEYVGFNDVFAILKKVLVEDTSLTTQQIREVGDSDDEIDIHRNAYQFLGTSMRTKVDLNILTQVHSPAEAWLNL